MIKIEFNCKLKAKHAIDKQNCDKVSLFVICIYNLTAKDVHTVK